MLSSDHRTQNNIRKMLRNHIVVCDWSDHLNVKFFFVVCKSRLQYHKIITVKFAFEIDSFCEAGHSSSSEVDSALDFTGAITKFEHARVAFLFWIFKPGDNRNCVEFLAVESSVILEIVVDLMDRQGNYGFMVYRLVLFFGRIHIDFWIFPALWIYIIIDEPNNIDSKYEI